jgi:hypothetical protein
MPTPCINCVRFHYGPCREPPRQCRICDGWYHIERYCPNKVKAIHRVPGQPLAGTKQWCEIHGLNDDPELKFKILQALKTDPGQSITINNTCIYPGNRKHFSTDYQAEQPRGRTLEERINRGGSRSLSPGRDRRGERPPSPSPLNGRGPSARQPRYRSRSPLHQGARTPPPNRDRRYRPRTPSPHYQPQYRARSPRYAAGMNAVVFEARDRDAEGHLVENRQQRLEDASRGFNPVKFNIPQPPPGFVPSHRAPLGQVVRNIPKSDQTVFDGPKQVSQSELIVHDPHFVLGIAKNASEIE